MISPASQPSSSPGGEPLRARNRRIIHVPRRFDQDTWGGTESVLAHLCEEQARLGWRPEIHTSQALCDRAEEDWRGIPVRRYPHFYPTLGLSAESRRAMDLKGGNLVSLGLHRALGGAEGVRVFHAHAINRLGGSVLCAARRQRRPFVVTLHGNVFDMPEAEKEELARPSRGGLEWGKPLGLLLRSRRVLSDADAVLCVGHSEFEAAGAALGHGRVYFQPNGVDPAPFEAGAGSRERVRGELGLAAGDVLFGCVSRIDPQKGQHLLVEAFSKLAAGRAGERAHLLLAGPVTSPDYERRLRGAVSASGVAGRIHWLPAVEPESARHAGLLAALDAFVLASRHEPFGIVVLEAWAAGRPVVVSRVGGLQHLVEDGADGLVFAPGDAAGLTAHLDTILEDRGWLRLAARGREKVAAEYTWRRVSGLLEDVYGEAEERAAARA